jgi:hypothetical protein
MRFSAIFLLGSILLSCAAPATNLSLRPLPLEADEGVFTLRYNPVESLVERPDLSTEIGFDDLWERISIEDPSNREGLVKSLLQEMRESPEKIRRVRGDLKRRSTPWGQGHRSRVLVVLDIAPESDSP